MALVSSSIHYRTGIFLLAVCAALFFAPSAFAYTAPPGMCTWDPPFAYPNATIISDITGIIACLLYGFSPGTAGGASVCPVAFQNNGIARALHDAITGHPGFMMAIRAAATLYIMFYALSFMLGIVQITVVDFVIRMVKLAAIIWLTAPDSWVAFYNIAGQFFLEGMDWLMANITAMVSGNADGPLASLDHALTRMLSARMFVTLVATALSGPYGLILSLLLLLSIGTFMAAILQAIWIYVMALVVMAFLLGLGPIFLGFMLFSKTRHLFDGWLNMLINVMLQPVLLFTFFTFFITLVQSAMANILGVHVCYMPTQGLFRGAPHDMVLPRFAPGNQPDGRPIGWSDPFPLRIFDIIAFLLLTQLTWRFNGIVINIAKEIAGASTSLNMQGQELDSIFNPGKNFTDRANKVIGSAARGGTGQRSAAAEAVRQRAMPGAAGGNRGGIT